MVAAPATTQPSFVASYAVEDSSNDLSTILEENGALSGTTPVPVVTAPGPSQVRHHVRDWTVFNLDTVANRITVQVDDAGGKFKFWEGVVPASGHVRLEDSGTVTIYRCDGTKLTQSQLLWPTYNVTNVVLTRTYDADSVTLNELAMVVGSLINDLASAGFALSVSTPTYTVSNGVITRTYDATSVSLNVLADVVATVILDLQNAGVLT